LISQTGMIKVWSMLKQTQKSRGSTKLGPWVDWKVKLCLVLSSNSTLSH